MSEPPYARELPLGFMMALAGNSEAMRYYASLLPEAQRAVADGARQIQSRQQMQSYVWSLASKAGT